jgi:hypothetical protein
MSSKAERDRVIHHIRAMLTQEPYGSDGARALQALYRRLYGRASAPQEVVR